MFFDFSIIYEEELGVGGAFLTNPSLRINNWLNKSGKMEKISLGSYRIAKKVLI